MTITLEFATIEARDAFLHETPPEGLSFYIESANEDILITTFTVLADLVRAFAPGIIARWIYDCAVKHEAKRIAVDDQQPVNSAHLERIITDSLEIGKND